MNTITPVGAQVVVRLDPTDSTTDSGLHLPASNTNTRTGTVLRVGDGRTDGSGNPVPMTLEEGDRILFQKSMGRDLPYEGDDEVRIIREANVLATLD